MAPDARRLDPAAPWTDALSEANCPGNQQLSAAARTSYPRTSAARLSASAAELQHFLVIYLPTGWSLSSGLSHKGDFTQDAYNAVSELISPEFLFQRLRSIYGPALDEPEYWRIREVSTEEHAAHQFAFLHLKAQKLKQEQGGTATGAD